MLSIRECRPEDYEAVAEIVSLIRPEPFTAEELAGEDRRARMAGTFFRLVAEDEQGRVVGYGFVESMPWFPPGEWHVYAGSRPGHRGRGVGSALYRAVERIAREGGAASLCAWCSSRDPGNFEWAQRRGFVNDLLRTESVLELSAWEGARFAGHVERVQAGGIRIEQYDGPTPAEIVAGIYEVERLTGPDVPDYEPDAEFPTLEIYQKLWAEHTDPRLSVVALDGERVVGVTTLYYSHLQGKGANTGYTGVLREYRGRGIALALKLVAVEGAVARGVPRMRTNNDFENPAMLAVNTKLGYQFVPGPRRLKKTWA